jgi:hypothetical protein
VLIHALGNSGQVARQIVRPAPQAAPQCSCDLLQIAKVRELWLEERAALLLDVFTPLASGPASAETVARACHADVSGVRALLDYLGSLRVLERQADSYTLTPTAVTFLGRGCQTCAGDAVLTETDPSLGEDILHAIRSG